MRRKKKRRNRFLEELMARQMVSNPGASTIGETEYETAGIDDAPEYGIAPIGLQEYTSSASNSSGSYSYANFSEAAAAVASSGISADPVKAYTATAGKTSAPAGVYRTGVTSGYNTLSKTGAVDPGKPTKTELNYDPNQDIWLDNIGGIPVKRIDVSNHSESRAGHPILAGVYHDTYGDLGSSINTFKYEKKSPHFLVPREEGPIIQMVPLNRAAWTAGDSLWFGLPRANLWGVNVENVGFGTHTDFQKRANTEIAIEINKRFGVGAGENVGHSDVSPDRKSGDPGPDFPWDRLRSSVVAGRDLGPGGDYFQYGFGSAVPYDKRNTIRGRIQGGEEYSFTGTEGTTPEPKKDEVAAKVPRTLDGPMGKLVEADVPQALKDKIIDVQFQRERGVGGPDKGEILLKDGKNIPVVTAGGPLYVAPQAKSEIEEFMRRVASNPEALKQITSISTYANRYQMHDSYGKEANKKLSKHAAGKAADVNEFTQDASGNWVLNPDYAMGSPTAHRLGEEIVKIHKDVTDGVYGADWDIRDWHHFEFKGTKQFAAKAPLEKSVEVPPPINPTTAKEEEKSTTATPIPPADPEPVKPSDQPEVKASYDTVEMLYPVKGQKPVVTSRYSEMRTTGMHRGLDLRAPAGAEYVSPFDAIIDYYVPGHYSGGKGAITAHRVGTKPGDLLAYRMLHFEADPKIIEKVEQAKKEGKPATVKQGEVVGVSAYGTGGSGPHMHFELLSEAGEAVKGGFNEVMGKTLKVLNIDKLGYDWESKGTKVDFKPEGKPSDGIVKGSASTVPSASPAVAQPKNSSYNKQGQPSRQISSDRVNDVSNTTNTGDKTAESTVGNQGTYGTSDNPTTAETVDTSNPSEDEEDWLADTAFPLMVKEAKKAIEPLYDKMMYEASFMGQLQSFFFGDE